MTVEFKSPVRPIHVALVLDHSASMARHRKAAHQAFNADLDRLRAEATATGQEVVVSVYLFGERIQRVIGPVPVQQARDLVAYNPDEDGTRLCEALDVALADMELAPQEDRFLLLGFTDGEDNRRTRTITLRVQERLARLQATDHYTVTLMVPRGRRAGVTSMLGLASGNVAEWDVATDKGFRDSVAVRSSGLSSYMRASAAGAQSTRGFYETDLSGVSATELRRNLVNVRNQCTILPVKCQAEIRKFCETETGADYCKGAAFYELTKREMIQGYKKLLVLDENQNAVYAGREARQLLGLPDDKNATVVPGNHAGYKVFVQSTSVNRRLQANTKVVYAPGLV